MKIISVVGARPQFIKYIPLSKELKKKHTNIVIHTGQHYDYNMDKIFFREFDVSAPDYNLGVGSGTHAYQTGEMLKGIENIMLKEKPDLVIVYGDTNSTLAGALSAAKLGIKLAHVEAGLRLYDKSVPEEINRAVSDYCSDYLFCPTLTAVNNLKREGITKGVYMTGDVMVDALDFSKKIAESSDILERLKLISKQYILVTVHRPSNTDIPENMENIANAFIALGKMGETLVFPMHPRTAKSLKEYGLYNDLKKKVRVIEPQGYFEFLKLINHAKKIIIDSGGIQKEAYILKVPCITLFSSTTWIETVNDGWNILVGNNMEKIIEASVNFNPDHPHSNLFEPGACVKIAKIMSEMGICESV